MTWQRKHKETWFVQPGEEKAQAECSTNCLQLTDGCGEAWIRIISDHHTHWKDRRQQKKSSITEETDYIRRKSSSVRVIIRKTKLPRYMMESSIPRHFQNLTIGLYFMLTQLWSWPWSDKGIGSDSLQRSLPNRIIAYIFHTWFAAASSIIKRTKSIYAKTWVAIIMQLLFISSWHYRYVYRIIML